MFKAFYFIMKEKFVYPKILPLSHILIGLSKAIISPCNLSLTYLSSTKSAIAHQNSSTISELEVQRSQKIYRLSYF